MSDVDLLKQAEERQKRHRREYTKLLELDPIWLVNYLAEMIIENDDRFEDALNFKDDDLIKAIIEQYLY